MKKWIFAFLFAALFFPVDIGDVVAAEPTPETPPENRPEESYPWWERYYDEWMGIAQKGVTGKHIDYHIYWSHGLHINSRKDKLRLLFNGLIIVDGGTIYTDEELNTAFPDLEGSNIILRRLDLVALLDLYDSFDLKLDIDFANVKEIKDNWFRFNNVPVLEKFKFGHFKEPFSIEELTSIRNRTFMEPALPTRAFAPGRNIGLDYSDSPADARKTWSLGAFLRTGSYSNVGEAADQISEAFGIDVTGRFTILPWFKDAGRRLLHLGINYSHFFADQSNTAPNTRFRSRPETRLTDDRLVDTGDLFGQGSNSLDVELATVLGPLSFQGEWFFTQTAIDTANDPYFWGFYVYGSYFLTGENREYNVLNGTFSALNPSHPIHFRERGSGAWELAARFSFVDLDDEGVDGGKEWNFTGGLNWYLNKKTRFTINYIHARVKDRSDPLIEKGDADILQARIQLIF